MKWTLLLLTTIPIAPVTDIGTPPVPPIETSVDTLPPEVEVVDVGTPPVTVLITHTPLVILPESR